MRLVSRSYVAPNITIFTDHRLVVCEISFRPRLAKPTTPKSLHVDNRALDQQDVCDAFQAEISNYLGTTDPELQSPDYISDKIRTVPVSAAKKVLPVKASFPDEFSAVTIDLIRRKRKLWKFIQKSGQRVSRSMSDTYRSLHRDTTRCISADRIAMLEKEAKDLADAFKEDRFKGHRLLKRQHRSRTKAVLPPEADFTEHYRTHYQLGVEDLPLADRIGCLMPIPKKNSSVTVESTRPICLLISIL